MSTTTTTEPWKPGMLRRFGDRMLTKGLLNGRGPAFIQLLTVAGRTSGLPRTTPVVPVQVDDDVWLVSPFGDVDWVRNLRANGELQLHRGDERRTYLARELDPVEAVPVLHTYLSMPSERFVRHHFDVSKRSTAAEIETEAPRHPTFALTPLTHDPLPAGTAVDEVSRC